MDWIAILIMIVKGLVLALAATGMFAYFTLFERRLLARFQNRIGPNRAGPNGFLQPIADAIKLFLSLIHISLIGRLKQLMCLSGVRCSSCIAVCCIKVKF